MDKSKPNNVHDKVYKYVSYILFKPEFSTKSFKWSQTSTFETTSALIVSHKRFWNCGMPTYRAKELKNRFTKHSFYKKSCFTIFLLCSMSKKPHK